jgi:hypothetical protein
MRATFAARACAGKTYGYTIDRWLSAGLGAAVVHRTRTTALCVRSAPGAGAQLTTPSANRTSNPNTLKTHSFRLKPSAFMTCLHLTDGAISPQAPRIHRAEKCHPAL